MVESVNRIDYLGYGLLMIPRVAEDTRPVLVYFGVPGEVINEDI